MTSPSTFWILIVLAYLLGSISFSYLIVRMVKGIDIRTVGSRSAGATNVLRVAGKGPALLALVLDIGKGAIAVLLARALEAPIGTVGAVGVAAVLGHIFPVFFGFRGGKGVATAAGTLGALVPWATGLAVLLFILVVAVTRLVSLGSILAALAFPLIVYLGYLREWVAADHLTPLLLSTGAISAVVVAKHRANIGRLLAGKENKLGQKAASSEDPVKTGRAQESTGDTGGGR